MHKEKEIFIAIVGCGFVADYYMTTLSDYPWIHVAGVFDIDEKRMDTFANYYKLNKFNSFDQLLEDKRISIILNLTNPRSHFEISRRALDAGLNVYSEKPLAMSYEDSEELVSLAEGKGLSISSAPCSLLGNTAQMLWRGVKNNKVGKVRLVYAELDDGMLHQMPYKKWCSKSGAPWPYKDEFEVGCTLEHAGYYLTWLLAIFGPVKTVTAYSDCLIPDKTDEKLNPPDTADFSVGILKFENGIVVRLTTTIVGPHNHSIKVIGDKGVLEVDDCWFNDAKVYIRKQYTIRRKTFLSPIRFALKANGMPKKKLKDTGGNKMDFAGGVAELASSILDNRPCRLAARFSLHVSEVSLALQNAGINNNTHVMRSRFDPVEPMDWNKR